jgi:tetratricopeptide (TPR) repeat protein
MNIFLSLNKNEFPVESSLTKTLYNNGSVSPLSAGEKTMKICPHCSAALTPRDETCSYCGQPNANYAPPELELQTLLAGARGAHSQKRYAEAEHLLRHIISRDPEIFDAYFLLADCCLSQNNLADAISSMRQAQTLRPGNCALHYNLGILMQRQGDAAAARANFEQALRLADTDPLVANRQQMREFIQKSLKT